MNSSAAQQARVPRILVVDDMPDNLFLMNGLLEDRFEVVQAASGKEALEIAMAGTPPDMILLDIMMPDMDGYEVLRRLRQFTPTAHVPVIFLTALAGKQDARLGLNLGASDYLTKPVDPELVLRRIEGHVTQTAHTRRIEELSGKLARRLPPESWERLFHGPELEAIRFEQKRQTILLAEPSNPGTLSAADHDALAAEVEWLATRHMGIVDRFYDSTGVVVFFDDPAACVRMAMDLHHSSREFQLRMGIRTSICDVGTFRSDFLESCTLIGQEIYLAANVAATAAIGSISISPETFEVVRGDVEEEMAGCLVTEEFDAKNDLSLICITPAPVRSEHVMSSFAGLGLLAH